MLKPVKKTVFTPTGEVRVPRVGDYFLRGETSNNSYIDYCKLGYEVSTKRAIYTKSIEFVQPEYKSGTYYQVLIELENGEAEVRHHTLWREEGKPIYEELIKSGNIYYTEKEAQQVADQINLLIQEKGYFTLYPENPQHDKDLKTNESMVWEQGDLIYDLKYKEVFSMELNRDAEVLFQDPQRFRLATEDEIKTLYKD